MFDNTTIDDLLEYVPEESLEAYRVKHYSETLFFTQPLRVINSEWKQALRDTAKTTINYPLLIMEFLTPSFSLGGVFMLMHGYWKTGFIMELIFAIMFIWVRRAVRENNSQFRKAWSVRDSHAPILHKFREDVENIIEQIPADCVMTRRKAFGKQYIKDTLNDPLAYNQICAEIKLDEIPLLLPARDVVGIRKCLEDYEEALYDFERFFESAIAFDLVEKKDRQSFFDRAKNTYAHRNRNKLPVL